MKLFLDSSGLLSVFDRSDAHHAACSRFWKELFHKPRCEPVISDYILDELTTRIRYQISHVKAVQALTTLLQLVDSHHLTLIWVDQTYFAQARSIFERYDDQRFSFTDCTSFAVCQHTAIQHVFTLDRDFRIFGLNVLPAESRA